VGSIYDRQRLTARQIVTVAERRFADAVALCETGKNAHANGAQYLGGFVIELLLKAQLVKRYQWAAKKRDVATLSERDREVWSLIYRSHDLQEMLNRMPSLEAKIEKLGQRHGQPYRSHLRNICMTWTVFARYSTLTTTIADAVLWLDRIRVLKEVLK
jgi:hypothetical protein